MERKPFTLFLEQPWVHRSRDFREACEQLRITLILNISYNPETNPIETCLSFVKSKLKEDRLSSLANGRFFDAVEAKKAFKVIITKLVQAYECRSLTLLKIPKE